MSTVLLFENKEYIASRDAARDSGYSVDYISKLCRSKKLNAKLIGKNWYVEKSSLDFFLSHTERAKLENQDKLSRERRADYRSAVFERKAGDVLEAVLPRAAGTFRHGAKCALVVSCMIFVIGFGYSITTKGTSQIADLGFELKTEIISAGSTVHSLAIGAVENTALATHFAGDLVAQNPAAWNVFRQKISAMNVLAQFSNESMRGAESLGASATITLAQLKNAAHVFGENINQFARAIHDTALVYINSFFGKFAGIRSEDRPITKAPVTPAETTQTPNKNPTKDSEGLVVVPGTGNVSKDAEKISNIQKSFSDDVSVIPSVDGKTGIIRPEFRDSQSSDYLYVLVPLENQENGTPTTNQTTP